MITAKMFRMSTSITTKKTGRTCYVTEKQKPGCTLVAQPGMLNF